MSREEKKTKDEVASIESHEAFREGEKAYLEQMAEECLPCLLSEILENLEAGKIEEAKKIIRAVAKKKIEELEKQKVEEEGIRERPFIKWVKEQLKERPAMKWLRERPLLKALEE
jgi:hypothetical protein